MMIIIAEVEQILRSGTNGHKSVSLLDNRATGVRGWMGRCLIVVTERMSESVSHMLIHPPAVIHSSFTYLFIHSFGR